MDVSNDDKEEFRLEYAKNWIKSCLHSYLKGNRTLNKINGEIQAAKKYGISKETFQIIIDSLPFDKKSERFRDILEMLKRDCALF